MRKILSVIAAALLTLLTCIPAYAAETVGEVPGNTDISVYAKYVDDTDFTTIPTDENGSGSVTLPDGTEITVSGADKAGSRIIVEEVTEKEVLDWLSEQLGVKANGAKIYYVYALDENGISQPTNGVTVTVKLKGSTADLVYAIGGGKTVKLPFRAENGSVSFTTDGSAFYALRKDDKAVPGDKSPQTGDTSNLALWIALLFISGGVVTGVSVVGKRKKQQDR